MFVHFNKYHFVKIIQYLEAVISSYKLSINLVSLISVTLKY